MIDRWDVKCEVCGKFLSFADLDSGKARHTYILPDSEYSRETFETLCKDHNTIENGNH